MFSALEPLVRSVGKLSLSLSIQGDDMRVIVVPEGETKEPALRQPLILTALPAELDTGFVDSLQGYSAARKSLADQVAATTAILGSAEKSQADKAQKVLAKGSKPALPAPSSAKSESAESDDDGDADESEAPSEATSKGTAAPAESATKQGGESDLFTLLSGGGA
jgi:PRTRC genetic system protein E